MPLTEKIEQYNRYFGFREHPEDFDFNLSPERVLYKNETLRTNNRNLYVNYLADHYPDEMAAELADFDKQVGQIVQMDKDQVQAYMDAKGYNLLQADLSYTDPDSIFRFRKVADEDISWELENNAEDLLHANAQVGDAFARNKAWIYVRKV